MNFNPSSLGVSIINKNDISELENLLLNEEKELQVVPYEYLKSFSKDEICYFCVKHGFYVIPTTELLSFLQDETNNDTDSTMEIGAGHGAISRVMNIRAVDNFMQERPEIKKHYQQLQQATVPYGKHVQNIDGNKAIERYSPKYVIGAYCTHKYKQNEHWRGGNMYGFNEKKIIKAVKKYIHIGNETVHDKKRILSKEHKEIKEDWIVTRSTRPEKNVIWIWEK